MELSEAIFPKPNGCWLKLSQARIMMIHKMKIGFIFILTYMCFLTPVHQAQLPDATLSDLSFKNMDFAMNLYRKISSYHDKNIFFSPLSISTSFAALLMASDGVTHEELLKCLNLEQLERANQPELIPKLFQLLHENITQNGTLKLDEGMALFVQRQFEVEQKFENQIKMFFDADIKTVDFADKKGSVRLINEYIKQKTEDKVTGMVSDLDPLTQLMLINTIFFQGAWQMPFDANFTQSAPFYIDNYNVVQVPMMFKEDKFHIMEDISLGAKVLKLPYQEGVSMLILLPNKGMDYTVIDDEISAEKFLSWVRKLQKTKLEVNLPKFKMEQSYSLQNLLPEMGMASIFSNSANLTRLSKNARIQVSEVLHKAVIEVDETGTTAAAATTIGITPYSLPRTFIINRPFFFFIYHEDTNCLLFMGRVIDPTKN
ncbi:protein Z-dependent protease inhibitor-like [Toxotes jaculatrix]|uniref:protein Z-dependent protease inhibitor-like n=1 Tax=Toxotes jaculatrix TaxID=941984 RepID=UPI001B3AA29A|nr:protein Z-dependent protease inhibitor-like [Toxotes jaculatrix]